MPEVGVSSVSTKGQVTLPKEVRKRLKLRPGDKVIFILQGEEVIIRKTLNRRLTEILEESQWPVESLIFQRELREKEWL